ncbi:MAG: RecBCD enzyme subunit RecC [marine bacterium B5-7]|nr:MAG: RecBCD enzyme subunit RecC [marine bacterium B5-7]
MLKVHYSNHTERLAAQLAALVADSDTKRPIFEADVLVVNNAGMGRWLQLEIARRNGIAANVKAGFPAEFVWSILETVLTGVPTTNAFESDRLAWHLFGTFDGIVKRPEFRVLAQYLSDADDRRRWSLACRLAILYEQYLVYRPDWIRDWESGQGNHWQALLWAEIAEATGQAHWANLAPRLIKHLGEMAADRSLVPADLPTRVYVFGIPSLSPGYLEVLNALGSVVDVHLFWFNPCREFWADIMTPLERGMDDSKSQHIDEGNPLLARFGKQGRDTLDLIQALSPSESEEYVEPGRATLLGSIQQDILDLEDRRAGHTPWPSDDDRSLVIHACHGPMREIEVLHDQLLDRFERDPHLQPSDVIVMTSDIDRYSPYIDSVFGTRRESGAIPYSISDRSLVAESPLVADFLLLLELDGSRLTTNYVLSLLDGRPIAARFELSEIDVATVRNTIRLSGVRFGLDSEHRQQLGLPATNEHTWQFALDRLVLGYAMPVDTPYRGILPITNIGRDEARCLGRFHTFVSRLGESAQDMKIPRPVGQWGEFLKGLLDRFFVAGSNGDEQILMKLRETIDSIVNAAGDAVSDRPVAFSLMAAVISEAFERPGRIENSVGGIGGAFPANGVSFCATTPMRSIPFKLVCLIGMDDGAFPRYGARPRFDLMIGSYRAGDRTRREDDRYLFMEAILCARQALYISYVGRDIRDDSELPPSVVVSDVLDYIARGLVIKDDDRRKLLDTISSQRLTVHPMQPFNPRYFIHDDKLPGYSHTLASAARALQAPATDYCFFNTELDVADQSWRDIGIDQLIEFYSNPTRYLLRHRLNVWLDKFDEAVLEREPFELDRDSKALVREPRFDQLDASLDQYESMARLRGLLSHGVPGRIQLEQALAGVEALMPSIRSVLESSPIEPTPFDFELENVRLSGQFTNLRESGAITIHHRDSWARDRIELILTHLSRMVSGVLTKLPSRLITANAEYQLLPIDSGDAQTMLAAWIRHYLHGLRKPLLFFPRAACAYMDSSDDHKGLDAARRAWFDGFKSPGEGSNPYYQKVFAGSNPIDSAFAALVNELLGSIKTHMVKI